MEKPKDIRWEQRFSNYIRAFDKLDQAVARINQDYKADEDGEISKDAFLDDIIKEGLIQRFEYTHELGWKVMKDYTIYQGISNITGSRDAVREAFSLGLVSNGEIWMDMIVSRNKTSHTYNEETADEIFYKILDDYHTVFKEFRDKMVALRTGDTGDLLKE